MTGVREGEATSDEEAATEKSGSRLGADGGRTMPTSNSANNVLMASGLELVLVEHAYPDYGARTMLPSLLEQREQVSIWSLLKQSIGKDLSRITMPVVFNEPISFLQRIAENMEYVELIRKASDEADPVKRLEYVAAFSMSALASCHERVAKPFNPILGETYELDRLKDLGFRIVCEQVSHHPPISAYHAEGPQFRFYGSVYPKLKFWGRTIDVQPKGIQTLELLKHNEVYTWHTVNCSVHNLVMGKMYLEQNGAQEVVSHARGIKCVLNFKPGSHWFGRDSTNHIEGHIVDQKKQKLRSLYGEWTGYLASCPTDSFEAGISHWGKEQRGAHKESLAAATGGGRGHSPPPNRRFSITNVQPTVAGDDVDSPRNLVHFKSTKAAKGNKNCTRKLSATTLPLLAFSDLLWTTNPRPPDNAQFHNFTLFAIMLNELDVTRHADVPPTDSRRRPDIRLLEEGNLDAAAEHKQRLEEKQRLARVHAKKAKTEWTPRWFTAAAHPVAKGQETWLFDNAYWNRSYADAPDLF